MADKKSVVPTQWIESLILIIRGQRVMLDADLAALYGVSTKRFNEQVKRNIDRFPEDFMFQLTQQEKVEVVANCDHLGRLKFSPVLPYAFTEHGAIMDSDLAILYGVETRRLNEQVKRNSDRFPEDFMFRLSAAEFENLKSHFATSSEGRVGPLHHRQPEGAWIPAGQAGAGDGAGSGTGGSPEPGLG